MIRHAMREGLSLVRSRLGLSVGLGLAVAIPLALGGLTAAAALWLQPLVGVASATVVVPVLLHPQMDAEQRAAWVAEVTSRYGFPSVREVPGHELGERMATWFPYLKDLLQQDGGRLLPPLFEVEADDGARVSALLESPRVIAVGPSSSLLETLGRSARRLATLLGACAMALLLAAAMLAAVWVHLELYRHADEITIMRLVGATESTVRGPFLVAVAAPGLLAGMVAASGTLAACAAVSRLTTGLGLPPVTAPWWLVLGCLGLGLGLPLLAAMLTLSRHAHLTLET